MKDMRKIKYRGIIRSIGQWAEISGIHKRILSLKKFLVNNGVRNEYETI